MVVKTAILDTALPHIGCSKEAASISDTGNGYPVYVAGRQKSSDTNPVDPFDLLQAHQLDPT